MNREIEYRAWDKETKLMFEVLSIDFQNKTVVLKPMKEHNLEFYNFSKMSDGKFACGIVRKFSEVELEEYTGKNDKNDNKIYEGDIVRLVLNEPEEIHKCRKNRGYLKALKETHMRMEKESFVIRWKNDGFVAEGTLVLDFSNVLEVIGNIHDKELEVEE